MSSMGERTIVFACTNPDYPGTQYDLSEFAQGAPDNLVGAGCRAWPGGFRGRAGLIADLLPVIRAKRSGAPPSYFRSYVTTPH